MTPTERVLAAYTEAADWAGPGDPSGVLLWHETFYERAWAWACAQASRVRFDFPATTVADLAAVLSPMKSWTENQRLTVQALHLYSADLPMSHLPVMSARQQAAEAVLWHGAAPSGPKVEAFAANIRGDLSRVTVDRHMLVLCGFPPNSGTVSNRTAVERAVQAAANTIGTWPAHVQATTWWWHRRTKGLPDYY